MYSENIKRKREKFEQKWDKNFCDAPPVTAAFLRNVASPEELKRAKERAWSEYQEKDLWKSALRQPGDLYPQVVFS